MSGFSLLLKTHPHAASTPHENHAPLSSQVCHSKSGEVDSTKVANLVKAYVDKYKYSRKGGQKKTPEEPMPADKSAG